LGYTHPKNYYQIIHSGCELNAYRPESIPPLAAACRDLSRPLKLHVKVDTGMTRLGVGVDDLAAFIRELKRFKQFKVVGLMSHLVDSGNLEAGINYIQEQRFTRAIEIATKELGYRPECHLANSGGVLNLPHLHLDHVRVGILSYGILPPGEFGELPPVQPCFKLASEVIDIHRLPAHEGVSYGHTYITERETTIAAMPCGYADGLPRALSNRMEVLIGGRRHPLVGAITMDYVMADVRDSEVRIGDEVVFIGAQGQEQISIEELSALCGMLPYEIPCGLGRRVRRGRAACLRQVKVES
jgi:alanine racemase